MSDLAIAPARAAEAFTAAELAARIPIPTRLPPRYDGQPLRHLSNSSYTLFLACPEAWRRKNLLGRRPAKTAAMTIGSRVDDAVTGYYEHWLAHGEPLTLDEVLDRYESTWSGRLEQDQQRQAVVFDELDEPTTREIGRQALTLTLNDVVPALGMPVAVQRRLEFTLAPGLQWSVVGYLDLETERFDPLAEEIVREVVDYKVKGGNAINQPTADRDPQAGLYLAGRWLERQPADRFLFAQVLRPGRKRKTFATSLVHTTRTIGQHRATLARIALAASQIDAYYQRFGPDRPWGFADPTSWKCAAQYCEHYLTCPGGAGL